MEAFFGAAKPVFAGPGDHYSTVMERQGCRNDSERTCHHEKSGNEILLCHVPMKSGGEILPTQLIYRLSQVPLTLFRKT
jgi:hypothetical protein